MGDYKVTVLTIGFLVLVLGRSGCSGGVTVAFMAKVSKLETSVGELKESITKLRNELSVAKDKLAIVGDQVNRNRPSRMVDGWIEYFDLEPRPYVPTMTRTRPNWEVNRDATRKAR